jgi:ribosomal protein S27E
MARDDGYADNAPAERYYRKCPACGKRYTVSRRYCDCRRKLDDPMVYETNDESAGIAGGVNVEFAEVNCHECGAGCAFCPSFSTLKRNPRGFGGWDCIRKQDAIRCTCCQAFIARGLGGSGKDAKEIVEGVMRLMHSRSA